MKTRKKSAILGALFTLSLISVFTGCSPETDPAAVWEERLTTLNNAPGVSPESKAGIAPAVRCMSEYAHLLRRVKSGGDFNADAALGYAILFNDSENAKFFIKQGAKANAYFGGAPMLHLAVWLRRPEMVKLLLENGADVNFVDPQSRYSPLMLGIEDYGDVFPKNPNRSVLDYCNAVIENPDKEHGALRFVSASLEDLYLLSAEKFNILEILLTHGANPNAVDKDGNPMLFFALYNGDCDLETIETLCRFGANPNCKNKDGNPLIFEIPNFVTSHELAVVLVDAGADVNARNREGKSLIEVIGKYHDDKLLMNWLRFKGARR